MIRDLVLVRTQYRQDGIFGDLFDIYNKRVAYTLEHAYPGDKPGEYVAKIPPGQHICLRGQHRLANMESPFTTFEVSEIPGHDDLLFHWGNYNKDSSGCILLGTGILKMGDGKSQMITNSKAAFEKFMDLQREVMLFHLLVVS